PNGWCKILSRICRRSSSNTAAIPKFRKRRGGGLIATWRAGRWPIGADMRGGNERRSGGGRAMTEIKGMEQILEALEEVIKASDRAKRDNLAKTIDAYHSDFPEDFHWAIGASSPTLLSHLVMSIDCACRPDAKSKPRGVVRLVDRKPEGSA